MVIGSSRQYLSPISLSFLTHAMFSSDISRLFFLKSFVLVTFTECDPNVL